MATFDPMSSRVVNIFVPRDVDFDLEKMRRVTERVLGKLGCATCHSGRILNFQTLEDFVVNPKTLEVEELAMGRARG